MAKTVIEINNLGKQYRLGQVGTGTMSDDLKRLMYKLRGKEDPFLKVGEANDRSKKGSSEYVWALKNINFKVEQGEVLGIIGKNGAGKSTLLKILSRTTLPTEGEYKVRGRIASLLEVGTGFHPDLSGRENIFLNGAILGMTKSEIKKQFDEIVDFSGVERYIDTPVKRYSSGMYVRLAFAVAAHLQPEILIVDEVLAVGDQEFQDKCIGKMKSISGQGRTVLFVSHNLLAVKQLCTKCMFMKHGTLNKIGDTQDIIKDYLEDGNIITTDGIIPKEMYREYGTKEGFFTRFRLLNKQDIPTTKLTFNEPFHVKFIFNSLIELKDVIFTLLISNALNEPVIYTSVSKNGQYISQNLPIGDTEFEIDFNIKLLPGNYKFTLGVSHKKSGVSIDWIEGINAFKVDKLSFYNNTDMDYPWDISHGYIEPNTNWQIK